MVKKFFLADHKKWLDEFEGGKTEKQLASELVCDIRTLRKGIGEARRARDLAQARVYLVREALQKHHDDLMVILDDMDKAFTTLPDNLEVTRNMKKTELPIEQGKYLRDEKGRSKVEFYFEGKLGWKLLKEHLPWKHPLVRDYYKWRHYLKEHIDDRFNFKEKLVNLLEEATSYKVLDNPLEPPFIYQGAIDYFYVPALRKALNIPDESNPDKRMIVDKENNEVLSQGRTMLAKAPGNEEKTLENLATAYQKLLESTEFKNAGDSYNRLVIFTSTLKPRLEETRMLRLLPNECRVCRQIGI